MRDLYFTLATGYGPGFAHAYLDRLVEFPTKTCSSCGAVDRDTDHPFGPFQVRLGDGRKTGDFIGCELPWIDVVQQRVVDLFLEHGVTGFEPAPVEVVKFDRGLLGDMPAISRLIVHGQGGPLIADSIILTAPCSACGAFRDIYFKHGLLFDEDTWDGSDFFRVKELPGVTLVTQKVADLIEMHKLKNARLTDTRNYPTYPQKKPSCP